LFTPKKSSSAKPARFCPSDGAVATGSETGWGEGGGAIDVPAVVSVGSGVAVTGAGALAVPFVSVVTGSAGEAGEGAVDGEGSEFSFGWSAALCAGAVDDEDVSKEAWPSEVAVSGAVS
jgi:hypothetical protein